MTDITDIKYTEEPRSFVTFRLARLQAQINAQAQHILKTHADIGHSEWRAMLLIQDRTDSTVAQIVRDGRIDKAQVSRAVRSLTDKGYVCAQHDPNDHRQRILSLTDAGTQTYNRLMPLMKSRQRALMDGFSDDDVRTLFDMLDRLARASERRDF